MENQARQQERQPKGSSSAQKKTAELSKSDSCHLRGLSAGHQQAVCHHRYRYGIATEKTLGARPPAGHPCG
ncbi:unnamed protein product [Prunus armeniaca]